jgi:sortase A
MRIKIRWPSPRLTQTQRWARWIGRLCLTTGIIALVYVAFIVLDASRYQVSAKRSLKAQVQAAKESETTQIHPPVKAGDVLARLDIPRLEMSVAVLQGTTPRTLRRGAGHIEGTPLPGEPGNSGIAGHRDTFFRQLKDVREKDEIHLQTATRLVRYEVDWMKIVGPNDTTVLEPSTGESTLTLVTCYPFYFVGPAPSRFVVHARRN